MRDERKKVREISILLLGGFTRFHDLYPELCIRSEQKPSICPSVALAESVLNCGPTQIFPHVYLGSERDALSLDTIKVIQHEIYTGMTISLKLKVRAWSSHAKFAHQ